MATKPEAGSRDPDEIDHVAEHRSDRQRVQPRAQLLVQEENQNQAGQGYQRHEYGGGVDYSRPGLSCVTALVKIVDHRNKAKAGFKQLIFAGGTLDKAVGGVAWSLK